MTDKKMFHEEIEEIRDGLVKKGILKPVASPPSLGVIMTRTEEEHLDEIRDEIYAHLRSKQAAPTCRNIIQAMFEMHYADWLGHDTSVPTCPYEHQGMDYDC
jgi:hypothetical protein